MNFKIAGMVIQEGKNQKIRQWEWKEYKTVWILYLFAPIPSWH